MNVQPCVETVKEKRTGRKPPINSKGKRRGKEGKEKWEEREEEE